MDDVESHRRFKERYQLNFPLLSDQKRDVLRRYGVLKEKSVVGVPFRWADRTTFVIDENGIIRRIFRKVQVTHHIREILDALGLPA
jgi:peroxiredoxin Q/BCP